MALTRKGTLAFGIGSVTGGPTDISATGISAVQSAEASHEYSTNVTGKDASGETVAHIYGDVKASVRVEGFNTAATLPALGSSVVAMGKTGIVTKASIVASNEDFAKISVEGESHAGVTYT